jgi:hypothetical protein
MSNTSPRTANKTISNATIQLQNKFVQGPHRHAIQPATAPIKTNQDTKIQSTRNLISKKKNLSQNTKESPQNPSNKARKEKKSEILSNHSNAKSIKLSKRKKREIRPEK